jgi:formate dehydrogenase major subunit
MNLTIDGKPIAVAPGTTIYDAAKKAGIDIPVLCHHPKLEPVGVCRLCVVDVGGRVLAASCVRPCEDGMKVETNSPKVEKQRRMLTALLLSDHPLPCAKERTTGDDELDALGRGYGLLNARGERSTAGTQYSVLSTQFSVRPRDVSSPVIAVDHQACILCDRCIRACDDIQVNEVIGRTGKGYATRIGFDLDNPMGESTCVSCGECVAACPTGALTNKTISLPIVARQEMNSVESVCPYCGVGCATTYYARDNQIVMAEGRDGSGNDGRLCVKGRYGWDYAMHEQRLTRPLIRRAEFYPKGPLSPEVGDSRGGRNKRVDYAQVMPAFREATWEEALDLIAERLLAIKAKHGSGALAGFGSAKCSNEEAYLFQKLMRAALGTNNVDHCTRLCHASSVAALLEGIGSGAVSDVFAHAKYADLILLTGSNPTANHPVAATFFKQAVKQRGVKLVVVDVRRPDIADLATHYCPIRPGTDVAFYNAIMHELIARDQLDHDFIAKRTENFAALKATVASYSPERVAPVCGLSPETIRAVAEVIGTSRNMIAFWGMGISQHTHGTDNARCLIALCLIRGSVGRPGTGLHPLRGQNNVQGASDAGLIPMMYPDYQPVENEANRHKFEAAWGVPLDPRKGLTVVEITHGALAGDVKGMLMLGENPFLSDPNQNKVRKALASLEFLAVQEIFLTETAEFADVILPASSFFEKEGTYTNTDRRVQIGRPVIPMPGAARLDWRVLCELSTRLGYPMKYDSPREIFDELVALSPSYAGLNYANLRGGGKLWPYLDRRAGGVSPPVEVAIPSVSFTGGLTPPARQDYVGELVLFGDSFPTQTGRGKFVPAEFAEAKDLPDDEYPLVLNTGRVLEHWHTGTMTRRSFALDALEPAPFVEVHPSDLAAAGIADGQEAVVRSRRGAIRLPVRASEDVQPGSVFIPFHFREAAANVLTNDALDPFGKIPEFKFCAVRLDPQPT